MKIESKKFRRPSGRFFLWNKNICLFYIPKFLFYISLGINVREKRFINNAKSHIFDKISNV